MNFDTYIDGVPAFFTGSNFDCWVDGVPAYAAVNAAVLAAAVTASVIITTT